MLEQRLVRVVRAIVGMTWVVVGLGSQTAAETVAAKP
jgi:hypothetical protein